VTKGDVGSLGEELVQNFFDNNFSKVFSFFRPTTSDREQVADLLVWMNRFVFLIEVKTRDQGIASIESWSKSRIEQARDQLVRNFNRIKSNEKINIHNNYYNIQLLSDGLSSIIGIIILVTDEGFYVAPGKIVTDIYNQEFPIHVFTMKDLEKMIIEIDTVSDFLYYVSDRKKYLEIADISLNSEMNAIGYYKAHNNAFPVQATDFRTNNYWELYKQNFTNEIELRNRHNLKSGWIDKLEVLFVKNRKLYEGIPLGLYYAWELGSISRRERAYLGEKIESVQDWFNDGHLSRRFAWLNSISGNWIVFFFSIGNEKDIEKGLIRLCRLKLIKEMYFNSFKYGVYGLAFQVSSLYPHRLLGVCLPTLLALMIIFVIVFI
jgi:hypothetical protein